MHSAAEVASAANLESSGGSADQPAPQPNTDVKQARIRVKNCRAQKKYRTKKQEEKRLLEQNASHLADAVTRAEAERDALDCQVSVLQTQLREGDPRACSALMDNEAIYIPASDGYDNLKPAQKPGLLLRVTYQPPRRWTYQEAINLTLRDHCEIRKEMVLRAGQLLLANPDRDSSCPEGQQLKELMREVGGVIAYLALMKPSLLHQLVDTKADTLEWPAPEKPGEEFWAKMSTRLRLSKEQEDALLEKYFVHKNQEIVLLKERERLRQAIVALMEASNLSAGTAGEDRQHALNLVYWISLVRGLRVNLDTMYVDKCKFQIKCSSMWTSIDVFKAENKGIDYFQDAQLLTLSWPYFPNMSLIVEGVAKRRGLHLQLHPLQHLQGAGHVEEPAKAGLPEEYLERSEEPYMSGPMRLLEDYMRFRFKLDDCSPSSSRIA